MPTPSLPCDPELFQLLVCPDCRAALAWHDPQLVCTGATCRRAYPVREGIPVMLIEESSIVDQADWQALMARSAPRSGEG